VDLYPEGASEVDYNDNLPIHYYTSMITNDAMLSIKLLFNAYPDAIKQRDCNNELPIHDLIRHLDIDEVCDIFLLFVSLYPESVQIPDCHNQLPIHAALERNATLKVIEGLIKLVPTIVIQQTQPYRNLLLHYYLKTGSNVRVDIVKCLISTNDSQLTEKDWADNLPIHLALKTGSPEDVVIAIIRAYINQGIELSSIHDEKDGDGNNIIMLAIKYGYSKNVLKSMFNEKHKYKMYRDLEHRNYFYLLAQYQSKANDSLEFLIQLFPDDLDEQNIEGNNALHASAQNQPSTAFIKMLIEACPSISKMKNKAGYLPIHYAFEAEIVPDVIKLIGRAYPAGLLHPTDDADGNLAIHIAILKCASLDVIRNLLLCNSSAASVKNNHGQYPITLAIQCNSSLSVVVAILFAYPLKLHEFKGLLNSDDHLKDYDLKVLAFVMSLLRTRSQLSTVHVHIIGASYAGKTSFRGELKKTLGKNWMSHQLDILFRSSNSAAIDICNRTIGMECDIFDCGYRRWIIHDYGGDQELHVNHSKFLASPGSIYIIVVALYDPVKNALISEEEILNRYKYWIKYIYSLADETPLCLTLINFKKRSNELDKDFSKRIEQLISNEQKTWVDSNIHFIGEPIKLDVINRD
jgi:ankyrin repeat protein